VDYVDYDAFRAIIVQAPSEEEARRIHPHNEEGVYWNLVDKDWEAANSCNEAIRGWTKEIEKLEVKLVGVADPSLTDVVILVDFNAG
jgi:hypothetical protein